MLNMLGRTASLLFCCDIRRRKCMIYLIAGTSHTGKTVLARKLLRRHQIPSLSIDHLKMGLIRSGQTRLSPADDDALTDYLWPIVREMIKTAIENDQSMIVEGCYIPHNWREGFGPGYLAQIRCRWLIMTRRYIENHWADILAHANDAERRLWSGPDREELILDNERNLELCKKYDSEFVLIDDSYPIHLEEVYDHPAI